MGNSYKSQILKSNIKILLWGVIVLAGMLVCTAVLCSRPPQYEPESGKWICRELQIQLDYDGTGDTFIVENEVKIRCEAGSDCGVKMVYVWIQDKNCQTYDIGDVVFSAEIKKLTTNTMLVFDPNAEKEYTFERLD